VIIESERVKAAFNNKDYKRESETENAVREVAKPYTIQSHLFNKKTLSKLIFNC